MKNKIIDEKDIFYEDGVENPIPDVDEIINNIEDYKELSEEVTLRDYQLNAIRKMLFKKRCIVQMATGAGKTEVMSGFLKAISDVGYMPTTLVIEPTVNLLNSTVDRFSRYGIDAVRYTDNREILKNKVNVCHPASLCNDVKKDEDALRDVHVLLGDECLSGKTPILLPDKRTVPIEDVYRDESITHVISYNTTKKDFQVRRIVRKIRNEYNDYFLTITYTNPITNFKHKLNCTDNHKIWTDSGYKTAEELISDRSSKLKILTLVDGNLTCFDVPITDITECKSISKYRYNLEIYGNHNYFANGILVSNCHHFQGEIFRKPINYMPNLEYSIGVSASAVSQDHVMSEFLDDYSYEELLMIGATGPLVTNITAGDLIDAGSLANPVLCMVNHKHTEVIKEKDIANWHVVSKVHLESDSRNHKICDVASTICDCDRKTLILVRTKRHAQALQKILYDNGYGDLTRASYGSGLFERYNGYEFEPDTNDVMNKFGRGEYNILIGTSHLYEGTDVPNLDAIILAMGGKAERLQIQGLGRVLRKTKSGKYAWIIDFYDTDDPVLFKQSRIRRDRYKEILNIDDEMSYIDIDVNNFGMIFKEMEDIHV